MTYTLYQYQTVAPNGEPVEPPASRDAAQSLAAPVQLGAATVYFAVKADVNMHLRVLRATGNATTADHYLAAGETRGGPVSGGAWVDGVAAS